MVNNTVFEYFRNNRGKYPIEALKDKAIKAGYPIKDIEDAIVMSAKNSEPKKVITTPKNTITKNNKALYKTTALFGILFFVMYLGLLNAWVYFGVNIAEVFNTYLTLPIIILLGIYYYGFYKLGKEQEQKNLQRAAITKIIITLLFPLTYLLLRPLLQNNTTTITGLNSTILLTYYLLFTITAYYLAITIIKTGKETRFAKPAGILNLLHAITITILYLHIIILYTTQQTFSFTNTTLTILYWEYIITTIFATSAYFFETMMLYTKSNE